MKKGKMKKPLALLLAGSVIGSMVPVQQVEVHAAEQHVFTEIKQGQYHALALKSDGTVWGWGSGSNGALGNGYTISNQPTPVQAVGLTDVVSVSVGDYYSLALKSDGTVWAWGKNTYGQLGDNTTSSKTSPIKLTGISNVIAISAGKDHSMAIKADGTVWTWGNNESGQLGDGTTIKKLIPTKVSSLSDVKSISTGNAFSLALKNDGTVWAWGAGYYGELGNGVKGFKTTPVQVIGLSEVKGIDAGSSTGIALKNDGTVWGWGSNALGQLGDAETPNLTPVQINGISDVSKIVLGVNSTTAALKNDGTVWAWGNNYNGQLGDGTTTGRGIPTQVDGLSNIEDISGFDVNCVAVKSNGTVLNWGKNAYGEFGDGTKVSQLTPTINSSMTVATTQYLTSVTAANEAVTKAENSRIQDDINTATILVDALPVGLDKTGLMTRLRWLNEHVFTQIVPGEYHVVALREDGTVWTWGFNQYGALGNESGTSSIIPIQVVGLEGVTQVAAGYAHTMALKSDGTVWAWGYNYRGELGDGTTTNKRTPVQVKYLTDIIQISAASESSVALKSDGTVWAWGDNQSGQLGDGTTTQKTTPIQITGLSGAKSIENSWNSIYAVKTDGTIWALGNNAYGQLGIDSPYTTINTPTQVKNAEGMIKISTVYTHVIGLKSDGTVWAWGDNEYGQLGTGRTGDRVRIPTQIIGLTGVKDVAAGGGHSIVLKKDGTVWAMGYNDAGQLGDNTTTNKAYPIPVEGVIDVSNITTGHAFSIISKNNGEVWGWGSNYFGQVGDETTVHKLVPTFIRGMKFLSLPSIPSTSEALIALDKAETSLIQVDLDLALEIINQLPESTDKDELLNRANTIQGYIDAFKNATTAVENAEVSKLQTDLDNARVLVDALPERVEKTNLTTRLDNLQTTISQMKIEDLLNRVDEILNSGNITEDDMAELEDIWGEIEDAVNKMPDSVEKEEISNQVAITEAISAVVKAEGSKAQVDVDSARTLVNALPAGTDKTNLTNRVNAVQAEVDAIKALQTATAAVVKAEGSKSQVDVDSARTLVNALPNSTEKTNLTNRLNTVQGYIDAVQVATAAVVKAEGSKTQVDVNAANTLVSALPSGTDKTNLTNRLTVVQTGIDTVTATNAVVAAESAKTQATVDTAKTAIAKLPAGTDKTNLTNRINAVQAEVDAIKALQTATTAVVKAEGSKSQVDVDSARTLVNALPNSTEKTNLTNRLNTVQGYIDAVQVATAAVVKAEGSKTQVDVNAANTLVSALPSGTDKTNLTNRLTVVQTGIDTVTATNAVVAAESAKTQATVDTAKTAIAKLPAGTDKTNLTNRINAVQTFIDSENEAQLKLAQATAAVVKAEGSKSQVDVDSARTLVNNLPSSTEKTNLTNRLNTVQGYIDAVGVATTAVVKAEGSKTQVDVNSATTLVNALPAGTHKTDLTNRLTVVQTAIDTVTATNAVVAAESAKTQATVDTAKTAIAKLPAGTDKTNLTTRINAVQAEVDAIKALQTATAAVVKAEGSKSQVDVDSARTLVNALPNTTEKTNLTSRLNTVQEYIDAVGVATTAVVKAEGSKTQVDVNAANTLVSALPSGTDKTNLTNRLTVVQTGIDTVTATNAVVAAESAKTQATVDTAKTAIAKLPAGTDKTNLTTRINAVQTFIDSENEAQLKLAQATAAVVKAEGSKSQVDVDSARTLVNALPNGENKATLSNRLDVVQSEIEINNNQQQILVNATAAVVKAEGSKSQVDIDSARILVSSLNAGTDKTNLETRLNVVQNEINAAKALQSAVNAVVKAENSKLQSDVNSARTLVNALPSGTDKTALTGRLDIVQAEIDKALEGGGETPTVNSPEAIADAEKKLKLADAYKRDPYFTNAEEAVNALVDSTEKTVLLERLETLRETIEQESFEKALKSAENKVIMAEKYNRDAYINSAREAVNALPDCPEKEALDTRLDNIGQAGGEDGSGTGDGTQTVSSARVIKAAVTALTRAETSPTRYNILYAERKVNLITDVTPEKAELKARLAVLQGTYNSQLAEQNAVRALASADRYVTLAEKYKNTYYFTKAETMVKALVDSSGKTALLARIEALRPVVYPSPEQVLISTATNAVEKAEQYPTNSLYLNRAVKAVDALPEGEVKTVLLERLNSLTNPATPEV